MKQTRKLKRTYSLGNFKNLVITNEFCDIPAEIIKKKNASELLDLLLLNSVELVYRRYLVMIKRLPIEPEDAVAVLLEERDAITLQIIQIMNGSLDDEEIKDEMENEK